MWYRICMNKSILKYTHSSLITTTFHSFVTIDFNGTRARSIQMCDNFTLKTFSSILFLCCSMNWPVVIIWNWPEWNILCSSHLYIHDAMNAGQTTYILYDTKRGKVLCTILSHSFARSITLFYFHTIIVCWPVAHGTRWLMDLFINFTLWNKQTRLKSFKRFL